MDRRILFASLVIGAAVVAGVGTAVFAFVGADGGATEPTVLWETEPTDDAVTAHESAVATTGGEVRIALPLVAEGDACTLRVVDGAGESAWNASLPTAACDADGETAGAPIGGVTAGTVGGEQAFVLTTAEPGVRAFAAADGASLFAAELAAPSIAPPAVGDVTGDGANEVAVGTAAGTLRVLEADGETAWTREVDGPVGLPPLVGSFSDDGGATSAADPAVVVSAGAEDGSYVRFDGAGERVWTAPRNGTPTAWTAAETRRGAVLAVGTEEGSIATIETVDGSTRFDARLQGTSIAPGGTDAGRVAVGGTGAVWAVDLLDGEVVWKQQFGGDAPVAPPATGDVTGDDTPETVAVTEAGSVVAMNRDGGVLARGVLDATVTVRPLLVDLNDDGDREVVLLASDGRAIALEF
ncbi:hypothetical protein GCM10027435_17880 [Haloparvum alkalitolerans]|uniref:outer membrane protein assembly factor BamB family protein n=1 Tax=Haloparvum alkalitolerans TaxID=1042953 RepID=UPI003CF8CBCD